MKNYSNRRPLPSWHDFEQIIYDELSSILQKSEGRSLLMNRRLGSDTSTEADILYCGKVRDKTTAIIIECKNRRIVVKDKAILLPKDGETNGWENITPTLHRKAIDARKNLGFIEVRFLVVGAMQTEFLEKTTPDCIVVGQRIEAWIKGSNKVQQFKNLQEAWCELTQDIEPLAANSETLNRLRSLPEFAPWKTNKAVLAREKQKILDEIAYEVEDRRDDLREKNRIIRQIVAEIEDGWCYPDE